MLKQFLKEEQGQSTVEYLLIIAVVVVVVSTMGKQMQTQVKTLTDKIMNEMNRQALSLMKASGN